MRVHISPYWLQQSEIPNNRPEEKYKMAGTKQALPDVASLGSSEGG